MKIFGFSRKGRGKSIADETKKVPTMMSAGEIEKVSPFIAGMNEYMERYGHLSKSVSTWRQISLILVLICAGCVAWVVVAAGQVQSVPFIVEVDRHGYEIAIKPVSPSAIDDRLIISRVGRFITSLKTVLNDDTAQVVYVDFVYKSCPTTTAAYKKIMEFYQKNNPLHIAASEKATVLVELKSILPLGNSGKTWRGEWEENKLSQGNLISSKSFTGIFEAEANPPTNIRDIMENPLGLYITDFNITEELRK